MPIDWEPLKRIVAENDSFVLTTHTRPDCDAIGSEVALAMALEALGKHARILNADGVPDHIAFVDPDGRVEVLGDGPTAADAHAAQVHVVVDTSAWGQLGAMADVIRGTPARRVVIDHHQSGDDLGADVFKDDTAEAAGRLVLEAIEALGATVTEPIARALLAAIATDTGWFRFPSVTGETLRAAARLIDAGARPAELFRELYDRNTPARVRLHGRVMESLALHEGGRVATGRATERDFAETGAALADPEDVVHRLLSVEGVEAAVLLAPMEAGLTKVSLRSRSAVDVRPVAERFGGGGHAKAAGVRYRGSIDEAEAAVLAELAALL